MTLQIVQDEVADEVLSANPFALLCGMILLQEVPVDVAFAGPAKVLDRFGSLDPSAIASVPSDDFAELCAREPAIHPYPESMSVLIQAVAKHVVANYGGDTASVWETADSGEHLLSRLMLMPGFNKRKAQMLMALLGKQLEVRPEGWELAAGPYAQPDSFRSVADVRDRESLDKVRNAKSARRKGTDEAAEATMDGAPAHNKESRGLTHVNTEDERGDATEETTGRGTGEQAAAAKAAKRAANKERRKAEDLADPEAAARRAAKRAARREADGEGGGGGGGKGRGGRGGKKGRGGRGGRNRGEGADTPATDAPDETD